MFPLRDNGLIRKLPFFCFLFVFVWGQQESVYTQYMYNRLVLNPAYVARKGPAQLTTLFRGQWVGFDGSPRTFTFSGQTLPFSDTRHGLGGFLLYDAAAQYSQMAIGCDYAFRIDLPKFAASSNSPFANPNLMMGLQVALLQYQFDGTKTYLYQENDPSIPTSKEATFKPDVSSGIFFTTKQIYAGISFIHLIESKINLSSFNKSKIARHYFFMAGYDLYLDPRNEVIMSPSIAIRGVRKAPVQFDLNLNILYLERYWLGFLYRNRDALGLLAGFYIIPHQLRFGYAYDIVVSRLHRYQSGTHEIFLSYTLTPERTPTRLLPRFF